MNSQYWAASGRSRPHCLCSRATFCGVAWIPRIVSAGSPGIRWIMKKHNDRDADGYWNELQQPPAHE